MPRTYEPIATTTLGSTATQVIFSTISGSYTDIVAVLNIKATSGSVSGVGLQFNSDTGNNYSFTYLQGTGSAAESGRVSNSANINIGPGNGAVTESASTYSPFIVNVMNYSNSTTNKTAIVRANNAASRVASTVGLWRNTNAITSIRFYILAGNFDIGSTFTLYGIESA